MRVMGVPLVLGRGSAGEYTLIDHDPGPGVVNEVGVVRRTSYGVTFE